MPDVKTHREQSLRRRASLEDELRVVNEELFALTGDAFFEMAINALAEVTAYHVNTKADLDNSVGWNMRDEFTAQLRSKLLAWYERREN